MNTLFLMEFYMSWSLICIYGANYLLYKLEVERRVDFELNYINFAGILTNHGHQSSYTRGHR